MAIPFLNILGATLTFLLIIIIIILINLLKYRKPIRDLLEPTTFFIIFLWVFFLFNFLFIDYNFSLGTVFIIFLGGLCFILGYYSKLSRILSNFFDKFFPFITEVDSWILVYIVGFWYLFFKSGKIGKLTAFTLIITIIVSDQLSSTFLKEWFGRIRPCHVLDNVRLLVDCGGGKSFPSSHAVNNFAAAFVITYFFKKNYIFFYS